jgi:hypothetical protein
MTAKMNVVERGRKTEQRVLSALYQLQTLGYLSSGRLGTYERLMQDTLASRSAFLSICQRLTREGKIASRKINAADRKRWGRQWPIGYERGQAHFLSPGKLQMMEAKDDVCARLQRDANGNRQVQVEYSAQRYEPHSAPPLP